MPERRRACPGQTSQRLETVKSEGLLRGLRGQSKAQTSPPLEQGDRRGFDPCRCRGISGADGAQRCTPPDGPNLQTSSGHLFSIPRLVACAHINRDNDARITGICVLRHELRVRQRLRPAGRRGPPNAGFHRRDPSTRQVLGHPQRDHGRGEFCGKMELEPEFWPSRSSSGIGDFWPISQHFAQRRGWIS